MTLEKEKKLKRLIKSHEELYETPMSYSKFTKSLQIPTYDHKDKKSHQLSELNDIIDFEVLDGKFILHGLKEEKRDLKLLSLNNRYKENFKSNGQPKTKKENIKFHEVVRASIYGYLLNRMKEGKSLGFFISYNHLAQELGFFNQWYNKAKVNCLETSKSLRVINHRPTTFRPEDTRKVLNSIRSSSYSVIESSLKELRKAGYIDFDVNYWGRKRGGYEDFMLTQSQKDYYINEAMEKAFGMVGCKNFKEVIKNFKEEEFFNCLSSIMENDKHIVFIKKKVGIVLNYSNAIGKRCNFGEKERNWINVHFYSKLIENSDKYYDRYLYPATNKSNVDLLLEALIKFPKDGDRMELRSVRLRVDEAYNKTKEI